MGIQAPLGFEDHLPDRMPVWRRIEDTARKVAETYGYREMRTPMMESTDLFVRSVGEVTDIVEKEMFTFDKGEKDSLTLRPELTASFVRACVEHGLFKKKAFQKLFYIGANFRKERPQKGRLRQFHQFGVEALGATDPLLDAETVLLALRFFEELGVPGVKTRVNSIGCPNCRPKYRDALKAKFAPIIGQFCENCRRRFDRNVFRILDCKVEKDVALTADAPRVQDSLCAECLAHDKAFVDALTRAGAPFAQDPRLVRGFDYYTRTVYEFTAPGLGAQDAIGGGGRYDNLIEEMGGDKAGAVGFAIGLERVVIALEAAKQIREEEAFPTRVFVATVGDESRGAAFGLMQEIRKVGISADMDFERRGVKAQFRTAERLRARWMVVIGSDELAQGACKLIDLSGSTEEMVPLSGLTKKLRLSVDGMEADSASKLERKAMKASTGEIGRLPQASKLEGSPERELELAMPAVDDDDGPLVLQAWIEGDDQFKPIVINPFDGSGLLGKYRTYARLRPHGFAIASFGTSEPKEDSTDAVRFAFARRRQLRIHPSGTMTFAAAIGPAFLGWAMDKFSKERLVNSTVLVEATLEFCRTYSRVVVESFPLRPAPRSAGFRIAIFRAQKPSPVKLAKGRVSEHGFGGSAQANHDTIEFLLRGQLAHEDYTLIAAQLLRGFYAQFGLGSEHIPFLTKEGDRVDEAQILALDRMPMF